MRTVPEWRGKTDDAAIPDRVKLRAFERAGGCCQECGRKIVAETWHCDHITPLWDGGEHREGNLQCLCVGCHWLKTGAEASQRAEGRRHRKRVAGIKPKSRNPLPGGRGSQWKAKIGKGWERR